jgi:hypothetical protein
MATVRLALSMTMSSSCVRAIGKLSQIFLVPGESSKFLSKHPEIYSCPKSLRLVRHNVWPVLLRGFQRDAGGSCAGLNVVAPWYGTMGADMS